MDTSIREIRPDDWRELRDLRTAALATDEDAFGSTLALARTRTDEEWKAYAHDGPASMTFVAVADGRFVGMARGRIHGTPMPEGGLYGMWVELSFRGRGVGRRLVEAVVAWARARGLACLVLGAAEARAPARALYRRCGFAETGRRLPMDHHPGLFDVEMRLALGPDSEEVAMPVPWKPLTYPQVIPYLVVDGAAGLMDFLTTVFDGVVADRVVGPDGRVQHGEARIGESMVMCGQARTPADRTTSMVYVYVPDTDAAYARALAAGATAVRPPADEFYGDRSGGVKDAWGNQWWMATHREELTSEEIARRAAARK